jgi:hypothetical protein
MILSVLNVTGGDIASQCVNKRVIVINAQGKLESENEEEVDDDDMPSLEDADNEQNAVDANLNDMPLRPNNNIGI